MTIPFNLSHVTSLEIDRLLRFVEPMKMAINSNLHIPQHLKVAAFQHGLNSLIQAAVSRQFSDPSFVPQIDISQFYARVFLVKKTTAVTHVATAISNGVVIQRVTLTETTITEIP